MKSARERMDIIAAYREVGSYRGAAALCGTTHRTVKRVIERHDAGGLPAARLPRARNYDQFADLVWERVGKTQGRISAKRLLPVARAAGYGGSPRNFRRLLAECFEVLGGVPKVVLADRMACLKGGVVANVVVPTPEYVRVATHYRFRPDFCEARDPESKGMVEHLVGYAKRDLLGAAGPVRRPG